MHSPSAVKSGVAKRTQLASLQRRELCIWSEQIQAKDDAILAQQRERFEEELGALHEGLTKKTDRSLERDPVPPAQSLPPLAMSQFLRNRPSVVRDDITRDSRNYRSSRRLPSRSEDPS